MPPALPTALPTARPTCWSPGCWAPVLCSAPPHFTSQEVPEQVQTAQLSSASSGEEGGTSRAGEQLPGGAWQARDCPRSQSVLRLAA